MKILTFVFRSGFPLYVPKEQVQPDDLVVTSPVPEKTPIGVSYLLGIIPELIPRSVWKDKW